MATHSLYTCARKTLFLRKWPTANMANKQIFVHYGSLHYLEEFQLFWRRGKRCWKIDRLGRRTISLRKKKTSERKVDTSKKHPDRTDGRCRHQNGLKDFTRFGRGFSLDHSSQARGTCTVFNKAGETSYCRRRISPKKKKNFRKESGYKKKASWSYGREVSPPKWAKRLHPIWERFLAGS